MLAGEFYGLRSWHAKTAEGPLGRSIGGVLRIARNRKQVDKLFVLGAGASLGATEVQTTAAASPTYQAPLDAEFAARIADLELERPNWVREARDRVVSGFRPAGAFRDQRLEEAVLRQLGLLELFQSLHPRKSREQIDAAEWVDLLSHLMCVVLRRTRENSSRLYRDLAERYFPPELPIGELDNRVLTFNYDTLFDAHLVRHRVIADVYFDQIRERRDRPSRLRQDAPLLLKLHGSANWRCSSNDLKTIINGGTNDGELYRIDTVWVDNSSSPSPADDISPLIIPPLPAKPITSVSLFKWLWTRAYEYLHTARELIIIGYSLPLADQVAESMFSSFTASRLKRVCVVDPSTAALDRWRSVLKRAGLPQMNWDYCESLADFIRVEK